MASENSIQATAPLLINAKSAQAILCLGERRLWELTNCRAIPSRKIGKSVRYSPEELAAWVAFGCPTDPGAAEQVLGAMKDGSLGSGGP